MTKFLLAWLQMVCGTHQAHINSPHAHTLPHIKIGHTVTLKTTQNNSPMKWGLKRIRKGGLQHAFIWYFRNWDGVQISKRYQQPFWIPCLPLSPSPSYLTKIRCFHVVQIGGCSLTSEFKAKLWPAGDSWRQPGTGCDEDQEFGGKWPGDGWEVGVRRLILILSLKQLYKSPPGLIVSGRG